MSENKTPEDEIREIQRVAGCWEAMRLVRELAGPCCTEAERQDVKRATQWVRPPTGRIDR